MSLTQSADGAVRTVPESAAQVGWAAAKLAGWSAVTVFVTFMMLRPGGEPSRKRGSLFLSSGTAIVLGRALLGSDDAADAAPASVVATVAATVPVKTGPPAAPPAADAAPVATRPASAAKASAKPRVADAKPKVSGSAVGKRQVPGDVALTKLATAPQAAKVTPAAPVASAGAKAASKPGSTLGPRYADKTSGYSVQFPAGWTYKAFDEGQCWIIDATDGQSAVISVGFSQFPSHVTVDQIVVAKVTKGLQGRAGTVVHGSGYAMVGGRRGLWHKYTGPIPRTDGTPRMTAVHYLLPLQDGRALEVRVAAMPDKFNEMAPRMKQSLDSFKLLAVGADPRTAKAARVTKEVSKG
jgi:hypothetical protein